jgi:peptidyl-prolyl cis-trans isomerase B (cyclophilin B)
VSSSIKRERQLARERYERRQAKRQETAMRRRKMQQVVAVVVAVLLVVGGGIWVALAGDDDSSVVATDEKADVAPSSPAATTPAESASPSTSESAAAGPCSFTQTGEPAKDVGGLPAYDEKTATAPATATVTTDQGEVVIELLTAQAPCTTTSFRHLADADYFDGTSCHRLTTENIFVLQCGDPTGTGTGGPGYQFGEENLPAEAAANYPAGSVAMANAGPGTNGSQFFLVYEDTTLPPNYTIFGTITEGLDVIKQVAAGGSDDSNGTGDGKPNTPVSIESVQIGKA